MKILYFFSIVTLFFSCNNENKQADMDEHIVEHRNIVQHAKHFAIYDYDTLQLILIKDPRSGKIQQRYFISDSPTYKDFTKLPNFLDKVITLSSTNIGMLSKLDMERSICGVTDRDYIYNALVKENIELGNTIELGDEGTISAEKVLESKAQIVFYSGFGRDFPNEAILKEQDVLSIPIYDWEEHHPLGKAEWILLFGFLSGKKAEALEYFKQVVNQYKDICKIVKDKEASVHIMSGNLIGDIWNCPGGKSYMAQIFRDANLIYAYSDNEESGSLSLTQEKILEDNQDADFWFNPGFSSFAMLNANNASAELFKSFQQQNVYCYTFNQDRYWELAAVEPHHLLFDYVNICYPGTMPEQSNYFFEKLRP